MSEKVIVGPLRQGPKGGTIIADRYRVERMIARGGMATVYLAHQLQLNRSVALKVLSPPPDSEDSGAFEERFRLEGETLAQLDHPNIVVLHDFGEIAEDGRYFLAMEYIGGPRLSDVLRAGPLPTNRALDLIMQVCSGLSYAHKRGVVHRDLKPSNLLIRTLDDGREQVKVVDFGLVKLTETDQTITRAGLILGSPHCMAPEQVKGIDVDHRADIYAIGVLLFRSLVGQYPFHGSNSAATMIAHLNHPIPTFFSVAPDLFVPDGLEAVVRKALAKSPDDRFDSMSELQQSLAACVDIPQEQHRSVSMTLPTLQRRKGPGTRQAKGFWLALVGFFALAGAFLVMLALILFIGYQDYQSQLREIIAPHPLPELQIPQEDASQPIVAEPIPVEPAAPEGSVGDAVEAEIDPVPEPAPAAPAPASRPSPVAPVPEPTPEEDAPEEEAAPEGYMGMPEDLFD